MRLKFLHEIFYFPRYGTWNINKFKSWNIKQWKKLSLIPFWYVKSLISLQSFKSILHYSTNNLHDISISKGAYINFVGAVGRGGGTVLRVLQTFQKNFIDLETMEPNISWPSNFFRKYFMAPQINFSFLFKAFLW